jgi:hypothetical protein
MAPVRDAASPALWEFNPGAASTLPGMLWRPATAAGEIANGERARPGGSAAHAPIATSTTNKKAPVNHEGLFSTSIFLMKT